jgi:hypothetical protein
MSYPESPDPRELAELDRDFARARGLFAAMNAGDREGVARLMHEVAESGRGAAVLMAAVELGLEFARSCESARLLADEDGVLTLQAFLDSSALNQRARAEGAD